MPKTATTVREESEASLAEFQEVLKGLEYKWPEEVETCQFCKESFRDCPQQLLTKAKLVAEELGIPIPDEIEEAKHLLGTTVIKIGLDKTVDLYLLHIKRLEHYQYSCRARCESFDYALKGQQLFELGIVEALQTPLVIFPNPTCLNGWRLGFKALVKNRRALETLGNDCAGCTKTCNLGSYVLRSLEAISISRMVEPGIVYGD